MNESLPFVSVLMTAYNREKYIAEAIESVLNSSYTHFELIIVDDCSTDKTFAIASSFLEKDNRVKLYKNDHNLGQFANRNKAIELSKGDYVKFLDSDDKLMPKGLEIMVKRMLAFPEAGLGVPVKNAFIDELPYLLSPHDSVALHYKGENHLCYGPTATIFKRKSLMMVGMFESKYGILTDTLLNIKIASVCPTVLFENDLFFWRRHNEQVTEEQKDNVRMIRQRNEIVNASLLYEKSPLSEKEKAIIKSNFIKINTRHFLHYLIRGQFKNAIQVKIDTGLTLPKILRSVIKKETLKPG